MSYKTKIEPPKSICYEPAQPVVSKNRVAYHTKRCGENRKITYIDNYFMIKKLFNWLKPKSQFKAIRIPRAEHGISRKHISKNALKVLYRLKEHNFPAYLVGGGVRDLLLQHQPKDFDIATAATPEQVRKLFGNCRLIGRRFRLAHISFGREIIEVATFRSRPHAQTHDHDGRILEDNIYGTLEDDVLRRDFTINALYYDIRDFALIDYVGGLEDLRAKQVRVIGDPAERYREDPVRMLRAIRFAAKLNFAIHPSSGEPILSLGYLLGSVPPARLFEEYLKLFFTGSARDNLEKLIEYQLFFQIFPQLKPFLQTTASPVVRRLLRLACINTDRRVNSGDSVTPTFLLAVFLWYPLQQLIQEKVLAGEQEYPAFVASASQIFTEQRQSLAVPRRFVISIKEIWQQNYSLRRKNKRRAMQLKESAKFRAAYYFLQLLAQAGEPSAKELASWWFGILEGHKSKAKHRFLPSKDQNFEDDAGQ